MDMELDNILKNHKSKHRLKKGPAEQEIGPLNANIPLVSEIPDVLFDDILIEFKLSRVETLLLFYIYRKVWCRPNLYKQFGIGPIMAYQDMQHMLKITMDELHHALHKLESLLLIETIRPGQYFVRRYLTEKYDAHFNQSYDDF